MTTGSSENRTSLCAHTQVSTAVFPMTIGRIIAGVERLDLIRRTLVQAQPRRPINTPDPAKED